MIPPRSSPTFSGQKECGSFLFILGSAAERLRNERTVLDKVGPLYYYQNELVLPAEDKRFLGS